MEEGNGRNGFIWSIFALLENEGVLCLRVLSEYVCFLRDWRKWCSIDMSSMPAIAVHKRDPILCLFVSVASILYHLNMYVM